MTDLWNVLVCVPASLVCLLTTRMDWLISAGWEKNNKTLIMIMQNEKRKYKLHRCAQTKFSYIINYFNGFKMIIDVESTYLCQFGIIKCTKHHNFRESTSISLEVFNLYLMMDISMRRWQVFFRYKPSIQWSMSLSCWIRNCSGNVRCRNCWNKIKNREYSYKSKWIA